MYFLSFETSTKIFSLALSRDEKVLRHRNLKTASVLEDAIIPAVDKMLEAAGIDFNQVDGFAIALGPGSFTSLRVGLSTIKAFALSTGKAVVGIPSLDIVAHGVDAKDEDQICVINDARRDKLYFALYDAQCRRQGDYLLTHLDHVLDQVHGRTLFVGDAVPLMRAKIEEAYRQYNTQNKSSCECLFADEKYWHPQAKVMAALAYERFKNKQYDDAAKLLPLYLYSQDCQVAAK